MNIRPQNRQNSYYLLLESERNEKCIGFTDSKSVNKFSTRNLAPTINFKGGFRWKILFNWGTLRRCF